MSIESTESTEVEKLEARVHKYLDEVVDKIWRHRDELHRELGDLRGRIKALEGRGVVPWLRRLASWLFGRSSSPEQASQTAWIRAQRRRINA